MIQQNWLDRAIGYVSPGWGFRRASMRAAMRVRLAYEGARTDRRTGGWSTQDTGANAEIGTALTFLRRRSRDLVRNTSYGARGLNELCGNCVGTGITIQSRAENKASAKTIDRAWKTWIKECDAEGQLDFYGLQRLAVRSLIEGGEVLVRLRPRRPSDGLLVPFQIQLLEADYLDLTKTERTSTGYIIQGVEFDLVGRRIAYWLYKNHPGEGLIPWVNADSLRSQRVDAKYVIHLYQKDRVGQVRGVPWLSPVIINMRDLDEYRDAELVRKKIESCFAAFITQQEGNEGPAVGELETEDTQQLETLEPGMIHYMEPGEGVEFGTPSGVGPGYRDFMRDEQTSIASGINLTYEQLTGDLSNVNYSSYRAGMLSFRTFMDGFRWLTFIPMFCEPIQRWFIDTAFGADVIPEADYAGEWHAPSYGSVDPEKDMRAKKTRIRTGIQTWPQAVAEEGYDPDEQIAEIKESNRKLDEAGIVLDCDPRYRTDSGSTLGSQSPQDGQGSGDGTEPGKTKQSHKSNGRLYAE